MKGKKLHVLLTILTAILIFLFASTTACGWYKVKADEATVDIEQVVNNVNAEEESDKDNNKNNMDKENEYDKEYFLNLVAEFFNAVKEDTEYSFFSSATVELIGSEEEYKNGIKTDLYFIIKESHSNWESIEIDNLGVDSNKAMGYI